MGGAWDSTNVVDGRVAVVTPVGLDHTELPRRHDRRRSPARRPGSSSRSSIADAGRAAAGGRGGAAAAGGRGRRDGGPGGHASSAWRPGGRGRRAGAHRCRASAACTTSSSCRCTAPTRRRTPRSRWPRSRRSSAPGADTGVIDVEVVRRRSRRSARPAGWRWCAARRRCCVDAAHNPHGMAPTVAALRGGVLVPPAGRRGRGARRQGRTRACWSCSSRSLDEIVVTRELVAPRGCRSTTWPRSRSTVFGAERVDVEPRLDDAIEAAVRLAEEGERPSVGGGRRARHRLGHHRRRGAHPARRRPQPPMSGPEPPPPGPPAPGTRPHPTQPRRRSQRALSGGDGDGRGGGRGRAGRGGGVGGGGGGAGGGAAAGAGGQRHARGGVDPRGRSRCCSCRWRSRGSATTGSAGRS